MRGLAVAEGVEAAAQRLAIDGETQPPTPSDRRLAR